MSYDRRVDKIIQEYGVEQSAMMKTPCLRYKGEFMAMMPEDESALIITVSPQRVDQLIAEGKGREFNFTKKRFKEWVLIPLEFKDEYGAYIFESFKYTKETER